MISPILPVYKKSGLAFTHGESAYLWSTDKRKYLDFASGVAVNCLGHAHPDLINTLHKQSQKYWHVGNGHHIPEQEELAELLTQSTFADTVFFTNSGVEAIECGLKMIRKHFSHKNQSHKFEIICCQNAFHGRSLAAITAGGQHKLVDGFSPLLPGFHHVPFGDIEALKMKMSHKTAGILLEPIQGEGGIVIATQTYLEEVRKIATEHNLLLFLDEIQCGVGRTGKLFFHEWYNIKPDIMAIAKAIGGGFPMGACLASENAATGMTIGSHGSTCGGNPLACALGKTILNIVNDKTFLKNVEKRGAYLEENLEKLVKTYPTILSLVRGKGLMIGLQIQIPNIDFVEKLRNNGLLAVIGGDNIVRLLPPLIVTKSQCDEALEIIELSCKESL